MAATDSDKHAPFPLLSAPHSSPRPLSFALPLTDAFTVRERGREDFHARRVRDLHDAAAERESQRERERERERERDSEREGERERDMERERARARERERERIHILRLVLRVRKSVKLKYAPASSRTKLRPAMHN